MKTGTREARSALEQQMQDARELMRADTEALRRALDRASEAEFLATNLRRQFDAQTRDVVALGVTPSRTPVLA